MGIGTASYAPQRFILHPFLTCYIPPNNGYGSSYLSTMGIVGTY